MKHRETVAKKNKLHIKFKALELEHMQDPKNQTLKKSLLSTRADLQALLHEETAFALYRLRRKHFECGDEAGKMLALQLKQLESKQSIQAIKSAEGAIINDQKIINQAFRDFYSKLYQSECSAQITI